MMYLDTCVVTWLLLGRSECLSKKAINMIETHPCYISPMVLLEYKYLNESKRYPNDPEIIQTLLKKQIDLNVCNQPFDKIINTAKEMEWTRDPFDRIITAQAAIDDSMLVTADRKIRKHYNNAVW